jgi:hypothetical protein
LAISWKSLIRLPLLDPVAAKAAWGTDIAADNQLIQRIETDDVPDADTLTQLLDQAHEHDRASRIALAEQALEELSRVQQILVARMYDPNHRDYPQRLDKYYQEYDAPQLDWRWPKGLVYLDCEDREDCPFLLNAPDDFNELPRQPSHDDQLLFLHGALIERRAEGLWIRPVASWYGPANLDDYNPYDLRVALPAILVGSRTPTTDLATTVIDQRGAIRHPAWPKLTEQPFGLKLLVDASLEALEYITMVMQGYQLQKTHARQSRPRRRR